MRHGSWNSFLEWLRQRGATQRRIARARRNAKPAVERLEDRLALAIYTVNSLGDQPDPTPDNGILDDCDPNTAGNQYTLRGALQTANSHANAGGPDEIRFNFLEGGLHTIKPASELPAITDPVVIDGYSMWGAAPNTKAVGFDGTLLIELDGTNAGMGATGLKIQTSDCTIKGLVINNFSAGAGILIESDDTKGGNTIAGNFIGTDTTGKADKKNRNGILIWKSPNNNIGGANPADRNIISGSWHNGIWVFGESLAKDNKIYGNYIGTDADGKNKIPNDNGVYINADDTWIGGGQAGQGNVISGNENHGIDITTGNGTTILANYIGVQADGTTAQGNRRNGVDVWGSGTLIGTGNVISANLLYGVAVYSSAANTRIRQTLIGKDKNGANLPNVVKNIRVASLPAGLQIVANSIGGSQGPSVDLAAATDVLIDDNLIEDSQGDAIKFDGASNVQITNNTIRNNGGRGVYAVNATDVTFGGADLGNTITENGGLGVDIEGGSSHLLVGNTITGNTGRGIFIHDSISAVTVGGFEEGEANSISGNGDDALVFGSGTGHLLLSNSILGNLEIWAGASVAGAGEVTGNAYMTNAGTFTVVNLIEPFTFKLYGDYTQTAGATVVSGVTTFDVTGSVDLAGGTLTLVQSTVVATGGLTIAEGAVLHAGIAGSAVLVADVTNAGTIYVGGLGSISYVSMSAYTQTATGTLHMELAGSTDYDHVYVAGNATLDGLLHVDLLGGYTPDIADAFTLLNYGSYSGLFADIDLPPLPAGREFETAYLSDAFILWVSGDEP